MEREILGAAKGIIDQVCKLCNIWQKPIAVVTDPMHARHLQMYMYTLHSLAHLLLSLRHNPWGSVLVGMAWLVL